MPSCREVSRLLASGGVETAPAVQRLLIRVHLLMCDHCTRYSRELRLLGETARQVLRSSLSPERAAALERAIVERVPRVASERPMDNG
jgi:hypothetical protein